MAKFLNVKHPVLIVDTELADAHSYVSEIFFGAFEFRYDEEKTWTLKRVDSYHRLVRVPTLQDVKCLNIYQNVTGLRFATLNKNGIRFQDARKEILTWLSRFDAKHVRVLARDPRMEQRHLGSVLREWSADAHVEEICDYLQHPYCYTYIQKDGRPEPSQNVYSCGFHDALKNGQSPHCAMKDVATEAEWLHDVGNHRLLLES